MSEEIQPDHQTPPGKPLFYKGRIGDDELSKKYKGTIIGLNGDYKLMPDLRIATEKAGHEFVKYAEEAGIDLTQYGFDINGDGKVADQEAASGCMAFALSHEKREWRGRKDQVISRFEEGYFEISGVLKDKNWKVAEQVLGDNWPKQVKTPTNTAAADKNFIGGYDTDAGGESSSN